MKDNFDFMIIKKQDHIHDVLAKMQLCISYFEKNKSLKGFSSFLKTYEIVTKKVLEKSSFENYFDDEQKMKKLDILFAKYYFNPLMKYVKNKKYKTPWRNSFHYFSKNKIPFVEMLIGISCHINGDLPLVLNELKYDEKKDFERINSILKKVIPEVMKYLSFHEHDFFATNGLVFKNFILKEFNKVVIKWRKNAWNNYQILKKSGFIKRKIIENKIKKQTEEFNLYIIDSFENFKVFTETKSVLKNIENFKVVLN